MTFPWVRETYVSAFPSSCHPRVATIKASAITSPALIRDPHDQAEHPPPKKNNPLPPCTPFWYTHRVSRYVNKRHLPPVTLILALMSQSILLRSPSIENRRPPNLRTRNTWRVTPHEDIFASLVVLQTTASQPS